MLPEVGASELLVIAIVALIVVGPKDLPKLLRQFGQFMAKLRGMASEFRASFDEMARQSELDDLRKEVEAMRRGQFADLSSHEDAMRATVSEIEQGMSDAGVPMHPAMSYQYPEIEAPPLQISEAPKPKKPRTPKSPAAKAETAKPKAAVEPPPKAPAARKPRAKKAVGAGS